MLKKIILVLSINVMYGMELNDLDKKYAFLEDLDPIEAEPFPLEPLFDQDSLKESNPTTILQSVAKAFACTHQDCGKSYNLKRQLIYHVKSHKNNKKSRLKKSNYTNGKICPLCNQEFRSEKGKETHIERMHDPNPTKYKCTQCEASYSSQSTLNVHNLRKHRETTFCCDLCDEKYTMQCDLNQHRKRSHKGKKAHSY